MGAAPHRDSTRYCQGLSECKRLSDSGSYDHGVWLPLFLYPVLTEDSEGGAGVEQGWEGGFSHDLKRGSYPLPPQTGVTGDRDKRHKPSLPV